MRHHDEIVAMYIGGQSTREISEQVGVSTRQVRNVLHKRGITLRGKRRTDGYKVNEDFFKTWSSEMAYVLGFVFTDGNVSGNAASISQKERNILDKINNIMESTYVIRERANGVNPIFTLTIHRKEVVEDLARLGITEGKSRTMDFPDVPDEYLSHFIRGVIDGDGWIQDRGYVMNVTNASDSFSRNLLDIFIRRGLRGRITRQGNANRVWVSGKQDVINLAEWIYEGAGDLFLARKRARFYVNLGE